MASTPDEKTKRANRISEARTRRGISKAEAARIIGIAYTTYDSYETGYREPDPEMFRRIAKALGVQVDVLLYGAEILSGQQDGTPTGVVLVPEWQATGKSSQVESELLRYFHRLNDDGKTEAVKRVGEMTEVPRFQKYEE